MMGVGMPSKCAGYKPALPRVGTFAGDGKADALRQAQGERKVDYLAIQQWVTPAEAGVQLTWSRWIPVKTGMTGRVRGAQGANLRCQSVTPAKAGVQGGVERSVKAAPPAQRAVCTMKMDSGFRRNDEQGRLT